MLWPALSPDAQKSSSLSAVVDYTLGANPCPWMFAVVRKGAI